MWWPVSGSGSLGSDERAARAGDGRPFGEAGDDVGDGGTGEPHLHVVERRVGPVVGVVEPVAVEVDATDVGDRRLAGGLHRGDLLVVDAHVGERVIATPAMCSGLSASGLSASVAG